MTSSSTHGFQHSRVSTPSCMADEEALVLARIIMDHSVIWTTFREIPEVAKKCHRNVPGASTAWSKGEEVHLPTWAVVCNVDRRTQIER